MSFKDKLKNKVLDSSDMYNHYKSESEILSTELAEDMEKLKKEVKSLKKKQKKTDKVLKSYNKLFNKLYLDYELTAKGALKYTQDLCLELLDFIDNVCRKHEITYWLDCGCALGAKRHGGYVPWDDDADITMPRKDYMKFKDIIDDEIAQNNLEGIVAGYEFRIFNNRVIAFMTVSIKDGDHIFGAVDIFPMDYIAEIPDDMEKIYADARKGFNDRLFESGDKAESMKEVFRTLNLSLDKEEYLIIGVDTPKGKINSPRITRTDCVFPLSQAQFEDRYYPCPNNLDNYLTQIYGEGYKKIPQTLNFHGRVDKLKEKEGFEEDFERYIEILKKANENFERQD
jgi:lipopolysaccharide cholinephosphotransferase